MTKRTRRQYTPEFKAEVVALIRQGDKSFNQICRDMDLTPSAVKRWVEKAGEAQHNNKGSDLTEKDKQELERLRRENRQLRMERDILKKATAFFAKEST